MKKFKITLDHLKLVKRLNVFHDHSKNIPCFDSYRPYGNSDWQRDIVEILKWKLSKKDGVTYLSKPLEKKVNKIHNEMTDVLQICLQFLEFETGTFHKTTFGTWLKDKKLRKP